MKAGVFTKSVTIKEIIKGVNMKEFNEFIKESSDLDSRNQQVDIDGIVDAKVTIWKEGHPNSNIEEGDIVAIKEYLKRSKNFSLGKLSDEYPNMSTGLLTSIIKAVKTEIADKGVGRVGTQSKTQSQADRINSFSKQKHIGLISRK